MWCGDELLVTEAGLGWARENLKPEDCVFKCAIGDKWPRVKKWHPWCVVAYMLRNNPGQTRWYVYKRDKGACAVQGCDHAKPDTQGRYGYWEADHIAPLVDGGSFEMENLQTLCRDHHKQKTSREAGERAASRKAVADQLSFELTG